EASNGRAYLGIARGGWLDFVGVTPRRPVTALREAMACVRHLLRRDPAPLPGASFPLSGGDSLRWNILRPDIPFLLGTWGEQTIRGCRDHLDANKVGGSANPDVLGHFRSILDSDAEAQSTQRGRGDEGERGSRGEGERGSLARPVDIVIGAVSVVDEDG